MGSDAFLVEDLRLDAVNGVERIHIKNEGVTICNPNKDSQHASYVRWGVKQKCYVGAGKQMFEMCRVQMTIGNN